MGFGAEVRVRVRPQAHQAPGTVLKEPQRVPLRGYGAHTAKGGAR